MINQVDIGYLKEIENVNWLSEVISERFDNALDMLIDNSIIYGGAVRDVLADKPLEGDLDIAVLPENFQMISKTFAENPRWIAYAPSPGKSLGDSGKIARELAPMGNISSFVNMNNVVVQLITSNDLNKDRMQAVMHPARMVDIVCCGVIMLNDGRVFETVPGAHKDCIDGLLRLNESSDTMYLDAIPARVKKLVARGWKNQINVEKAVAEIKLKRERSKKPRKKSGWVGNNQFKCPDKIEYEIFMYNKTLKLAINGHKREIKNLYELGDSYTISSHVNNICRICRLNARIIKSPLGQIYIECADRITTSSIIAKLDKYRRKRKTSKRALSKQSDYSLFGPSSDAKKVHYKATSKQYENSGTLTGRSSGGRIASGSVTGPTSEVISEPIEEDLEKPIAYRKDTVKVKFRDYNDLPENKKHVIATEIREIRGEFEALAKLGQKATTDHLLAKLKPRKVVTEEHTVDVVEKPSEVSFQNSTDVEVFKKYMTASEIEDLKRGLETLPKKKKLKWVPLSKLDNVTSESLSKANKNPCLEQSFAENEWKTAPIKKKNTIFDELLLQTKKEEINSND